MEVDTEAGDNGKDHHLLGLVESGFVGFSPDSINENGDDFRPIMFSFQAACCAGRIPLQSVIRWPGFVFVSQLRNVDVDQLQTEIEQLSGLFRKSKDVLNDTLFKSSDPVRSAYEYERRSAYDKAKVVWTYLIALKIATETEHINIEQQAISFDMFDNSSYASHVADCILLGIKHMQKLDVTVEDLISLLLPFNCADMIIRNVVLNTPSSYWTCINRLISDAPKFHTVVLMTASKQEAFNGVYNQRANTLSCLLQLRPSSTVVVVQRMIGMHKMPVFCLKLVLDKLQPTQLVQCLTSWCTMAETTAVSQLQSALKGAVDDGVSEKLCDKLCSISASLMCPDADHVMVTDDTTNIKPAILRDDTLLLAADLMRLIALLKQRARLHMQGRQAEQLLRFICSRTSVDHALSVRVLPLAVVTLAACPTLIQLVDETLFQTTVSDWLRWMLNAISSTSESLLARTAVQTGFSELLLLLAFHFHSNQVPLISQLVSETLKFKVVIKGNVLARLRHIFIEDVMPEALVAEMASRMPVTRQLSASMTGFLPVHCVVQLLKTRSFGKHNINISDWIISQLRECVAPIHQVMIELVDSYIATVLHTSTESMQSNVQLDEPQLQACFPADQCLSSKQLASKLLVLYYLLSYDYKYERSARRFTGTPSSGASKLPTEYSDTLWSSVPVRFLLFAASRDPQLYGTVYAPLVRLVSTQCAYLFSPNPSCSIPMSNANTTPLPVAQLTASAHTRNWTNLHAALCHIHKQPLDMQQRYVSALCQSLPVILEEGVCQLVLNAYDTLWRSWECVLARRLYEHTLYSLRHESLKSTDRATAFCHAAICDDPLILFRCRRQVFSTPTVFKWYMSMLTFYLAASRRQLHHRVAITPILLPDSQLRSFSRHQPVDEGMAEMERNELTMALIRAQESAVVQILLELCLPPKKTDEKSDTESIKMELKSYKVEIKSEPNGLDSVQTDDLMERAPAITRIVCEHVHSMIIPDTQLLRLVIYQGFDPRLLPTVVALIPSMWCCVDWLPDMLAQPNLRQRCFAINLMAALCTQYRLIRCYTLSNLCIDTLNTILYVLPTSTSLAVMRVCIDSVARMASSCPPLVPQVTTLLTQISGICRSRLGWKSLKRPRESMMTSSDGSVDSDVSLCQDLMVKVDRAFDILVHVNQ